MIGTILISTIPRSGTWHLRYFFRFLADHQRGIEPSISDVFRDVNDAHVTGHLAHLGVATLRIDHFPFPGALDLPDNAHPAVATLRGLCERLDRGDFDRRADLVTSALQPRAPTQRCVLVHRNIFDQFASTAIRDTKWTAQWPLDLSRSQDDSLAARFAAMIETNVCEAHAIAILGFKIGADLYPGRVAIARYEDVITGGLAGKRRLLEFLGVPCSDSVLARTCEAVSKPRMLDYEKQLGRALSGGVSNRGSHISENRVGLYREHVSPALARRVRARLDELGIMDELWRGEDDDLLRSDSDDAPPAA